MADNKYAPISYSLAPCQSCKSERVMLLSMASCGHKMFKVECIGHPEDPPFCGERIKCGIKTSIHHQWTKAVDEWNWKNR